MKRSCITIIGAGQIGSRHLQALCHLKSLARIDLVDPSDKSLQIAQDRYEDVISSSKKNIELHCHKNIADLPENLDLVIISTNSIVREKVIRGITKKCHVKNFILEKVLFQKKEQYNEVENFLKKSSIPTWVSCWMRTTDLFKKIKSDLNLNDPIQMKIEGGQWGMGTNSLHYLDLFSFFTECDEFKFIEMHLEDKVLDAKRKGFKEFMGHLIGRNTRGDSLELICKSEAGELTRMEIKNGPERYIFGTNFMDHFDFKSSNGLASQIGKVSLPYQSEMTHIWVNDILTKGSCDLPTYSNSMCLHLELVRVFINHLQKITGKAIDACPIT